jgi:D-3-phosphoglycerate dehydrogenase
MLAVMRILFADAVDPSTVETLAGRGHNCSVAPSLTSQELPKRIGGFEALVVRSTRVEADTILAGEDLELIIRAGAGTNTIDTQAAAAVGIYVSNVPGRNSIAVAELTMGLLLAIDRRIPEGVADLRAGRWDKKTYSKADGLFGKTFGIVGLGDIGKAVAERASAFGMHIQTIARPKRSPQTEALIRRLGIHLFDTLEDLVAGSDVVSIHMPATPDTFGLFDARILGLMRPGSILLNTARGDIVDAGALLAALETGGLRAGLDVYPDEPSTPTADWSSGLAQHPRVVGTHHIGASTEQAQRAIAEGVVEIIDSYQRGEILHCVNLSLARLGNCTLHIRHLDRVGVLAQIFDILRRNNLNVEQMENRIFIGSMAAVATINVVGDVTSEVVGSLLTISDVLHVSYVLTD